jgi:hypothetical protein
VSSYVSTELRRLVRERANGLCEYCLIHEDDTFYGCQVDHIISEKHGGRTDAENLAYACSFCNRFKGTDLGSIASQTGELTRFYNPRTDQWSEHFRLDGAQIIPRTSIGEVTSKVFGLNAFDRIVERTLLVSVGRYPTAAALLVIRISSAD